MADPQTIVRDGSGTRQATYQLPPGLFQYVESVLVEVNNGAAGDVRPTLQVQTVNGQVMAAKRQGEAIPAGDTGTATWALRLADEQVTGSGLTVASAEYSGNFVNIGVGLSDVLTWDSLDVGTALLDLTVPAVPTVLTDGLYIVNATLAARGGGVSFRGSLILDFLGAGAATVGVTGDVGSLGATGFLSLTVPYFIPAGGPLRAEVLNLGGVAEDFYVNEANIVRLT